MIAQQNKPSVSAVPGKERRTYFRLDYPIGDRARIRIGIDVFPVSQISEYGVRIVCTSSAFMIGQAVAGLLITPGGHQCEIEGKILRFDAVKSEMILKCQQKTVPQQTVFDEQRYLMMKFDQRANSSLHYPDNAGGCLIIKSRRCLIREMSSDGVHFIIPENLALTLNERISGIVQTLAGYTTLVKGDIVRLFPEKRLAVLYLNVQPIPLEIIKHEQRVLKT